MSVPLFSRMSVTSKSEIRYEGTLVEVNAAASTITLAQVRVFGTEGRRPQGEIAPSPQVFESIIFRGSDIKELKVLAPPPVLPTTPSIAQPTQKQPSAFAAAAPGAGAATAQSATLPTFQPPSSYVSSSQTTSSGLPRVPEVSRMSKLFEGSAKPEQQQATQTATLPSLPTASSKTEEATSKKTVEVTKSQNEGKKTLPNLDGAGSTKPTKTESPKPSTKPSSPKPPPPTQTSVAKKSVFDGTSGGGRQTSVVTVEGLTHDANVGQVRQLFEDQSAIVSVKMMTLPSGKIAADVVFGDLDAASRAVADFSHPGLTASHMETPALAPPRARREDNRTFGGGERRTGPPQVRQAHGPPTVNDRDGVNRGGRGGSAHPRSDRSRKLEENGGAAGKKAEDVKADFDFSASNAKFDRSELPSHEGGASNQSKSKGFFDEVSMSQNLEMSQAQRASDMRKKDAETFGAIAYSYRGGGTFRGGRGGGGRGRGGGERGRGGREPRGRSAVDGEKSAPPSVAESA